MTTFRGRPRILGLIPKPWCMYEIDDKFITIHRGALFWRRKEQTLISAVTASHTISGLIKYATGVRSIVIKSRGQDDFVLDNIKNYELVKNLIDGIKDGPDSMPADAKFGTKVAMIPRLPQEFESMTARGKCHGSENDWVARGTPLISYHTATTSLQAMFEKEQDDFIVRSPVSGMIIVRDFLYFESNNAGPANMAILMLENEPRPEPTSFVFGRYSEIISKKWKYIFRRHPDFRKGGKLYGPDKIEEILDRLLSKKIEVIDVCDAPFAIPEHMATSTSGPDGHVSVYVRWIAEHYPEVERYLSHLLNLDENQSSTADKEQINSNQPSPVLAEESENKSPQNWATVLSPSEISEALAFFKVSEPYISLESLQAAYERERTTRHEDFYPQLNRHYKVLRAAILA